MANFDIGTGGSTESPCFGLLSGDFEGANVLLVEDDPDVSELMSTLLQLGGLATTACGTAEMALEHLREQHFDLVLTDYMLPQRTGGWLLKQATEEGLIDGTPVLVLTAHPDPADVRGFEIITKPCDLDHLVSRIRKRLASGSSPPPIPRGDGSRAGSSGGGGDHHTRSVELVLYISRHSPETDAAISNIKLAIARSAPDRVSLTICDLSSDSQDGHADRIAVTPTLVKRSPSPRTFIVGHITSPDIVEELLKACDDADRQ